MNSVNLKCLPEDERPREKLINKGARELSLIDLMAIVLGSGTKGKSVLQLSQEVVSVIEKNDIDNGANLANALRKIEGVGPAKIATIIAMIEFGRRIVLKSPLPKVYLTRPWEVVDYVRGHYIGIKQEIFSCILLNTKRQVIALIDIFKGSLDMAIVHPREIFQAAITHCASAIIAIHNHPSGHSTPSKEDIDITKKLVETGKIVGIPVLDHIIIGDSNFTSLKQDGMIQ